MIFFFFYSQLAPKPFAMKNVKLFLVPPGRLGQLTRGWCFNRSRRFVREERPPEGQRTTRTRLGDLVVRSTRDPIKFTTMIMSVDRRTAASWNTGGGAGTKTVRINTFFDQSEEVHGGRWRQQYRLIPVTYLQRADEILINAVSHLSDETDLWRSQGVWRPGEWENLANDQGSEINVVISRSRGRCIKNAGGTVIDEYRRRRRRRATATATATDAAPPLPPRRARRVRDRCLWDKNMWPTGGRSTRVIPVTSFHLNSLARARERPLQHRRACVCSLCSFVYYYRYLLLLVFYCENNTTVPENTVPFRGSRPQPLCVFWAPIFCPRLSVW